MFYSKTHKCRAVSLIICAAMVVNVVNSSLAATTEFVSASENEVIAEQKVYSDAEISDQFAEDRVLVVLSNAASTSMKDFSTEDFAEIACKTLQI